MHPFFGSKTGKTFAIKTNAVITDEIGVFTGFHTICREIDLTVILIYPKHFAYIPFSFSNLIIGLCGRGEYDSAGKYVILWDTEDAGGAGNPEGRGREVSNFFLSL